MKMLVQPNAMADNFLYYGDNLDVLRRHVKDESVDLTYLDPPFKSNKNYNVLFTEQDGSRAAAQIKAFEDTWQWDQSAASAYEETVEAGGDVARALVAFRGFLGENDMMSYLSMMAPRLAELRRVLKRTGTLYLHCDTAASHYLKMLLDAAFIPRNFRNEIIWCYRGGGVPRNDFAWKHDTIFRYSKTDNYTFNLDAVRIPYSEDVMASLPSRYDKSYRSNKTYEGYKPNPLGKHPEDWWTIQPLMPSDRTERMGYPTQKPRVLLKRIIAASSNANDVVLDPFCGCGTTIDAAEELGRKWIGIDVTPLAINLIKHRLLSRYGAEVETSYKVIGEPVSLPDAEHLAKQDPMHFQYWALGLVGARPADQKRGADQGTDGQLYFHDEAKAGKTKQIVFSVKAGHTGPAHVRDLRGVVEREKAAIGVLIAMQEPTQPMRTEAASAGFYQSPFGKYPKLQILTVSELLGGKGIQYPSGSQRIDKTFKRAAEKKAESAEDDLPFT